MKSGAQKIIADLQRDLAALSNYKIPPPFFGPIAAAQANKSFQDDHFQQYDIECMNYIVEKPKEDEKPKEEPQKVDNEGDDPMAGQEEFKQSERPVNDAPSFGIF